MDVQFFKPFVDGTIKTLQIQANVEIKTAKPFFKKKEDNPHHAIAGIIGLASARFSGSIALCFPEKVFLYIMSQMLGEEYSEIDDDLQDGVAEMLNIIFGQAKTVLNDQGYKLEMALPNIIRGKEIQTFSVTGGTPVVVLPFTTEVGEFYIEIATQEQERT